MTSSPRPTQLLSLGRAIREIREEQGLTDLQLAERAGMTHKRVTAIEEGKSSYDYATLLALADAFGIGASALVIRAKAIDDEEADHA
jgi:transcriptional regulator with XRE-family HTH domain